MSDILKNYRTSLDFQEIVHILSSSKDQGKNIIWQTFSNERRIYEVTDISVDLTEKQILVTCSHDAGLIEADVDIYVKLSYMDTIFKGRLIKFIQNKLVISIPDEVKTQELRAYPRVKLGVEEDYYAFLAPVAPTSVLSKTVQMKVRLLDISAKGLGLTVSDMNRRLFMNGTKFFLQQIGDLKFTKTIVGTVVFGKASEGRSYRVGMRLEEEIDGKIYHSFLEGITFAYHRDLPGTLMKSVLGKTFKKKLGTEVAKRWEAFNKCESINTQLKLLEKNVRPTDYIYRHIDLLIYLMSSIYKCMNKNPEEILDKIVYVSYIHDAPFFGFPRIAEIKNLKDFQNKRAQLSGEEQLLFLDGPLMARDLARADQLAPAEVDRILFEHRESSKKDGFPMALSHAEIGPLSALFIVAHDLTDYILSMPRWNFGDYLAQSRNKFSEGQFVEIISAVEKLKIALGS